MSRAGVLLSRLGGLFGRSRGEARLDEEVREHLDRLTDDHVRRGLALADARAAARRDFGGVDQIKETYRDAVGLRFVDDLGCDLRYALRSARRNPAFTIVALLSLASTRTSSPCLASSRSSDARSAAKKARCRATTPS